MRNQQTMARAVNGSNGTREFERDVCKLGSLVARKVELKARRHSGAVTVGNTARPIWRATMDLVVVEHTAAKGVPRRHEDHAVVGELSDRRQCSRLLATSLDSGGEKDTARLANEVALRPKL